MKKLEKFFKSPLGQKIVKGCVSILRNAVIVSAGLILTELPKLVAKLELDPFTKALVIGGLKVIDETLHKTGIAEKGITRF